MDLTSKGKIFSTIALLSFFISIMIVSNGFFPYFGMSLSFILFAILVFVLKKDKTKRSKTYFSYTLIFAALIMIRSEGFVTFLNIAATLLFGSLMITDNSKTKKGLIDHITNIPMLLIKSVFTKSDYYLEERSGSQNKLKIFLNTLFGVLVTLLTAVVVIPLLSSSNPIFRNLVDATLKYLNIFDLLNNLNSETLFAWVARLFLTIVFAFLFTKMLSLMKQEQDVRIPINFNLQGYSLTMPKTFLSGVLIIFFVTQLQFYFASSETLTSLGINNSTHAREVFAQLSIVTGILMLLLYNGRSAKNKWLDWLLGAQGVFLVLMAYKSAFEYIGNWGLTYKRLYGVSVATWILGIIILYFRNWQKKDDLYKFVHQTLIYSGVILFAINLLNFDYLIYHYKNPSTGEGIDNSYMYTLSADSLSYQQQVKDVQLIMENGEGVEFEYNKNPLRILYKVQYLQTKYTDRFDIRNFNLLEYLSFSKIKDTNINGLLNYFQTNNLNSYIN